MTEKKEQSTKMVTPEIVCSFPHLFKAVDPFDSGTLKFTMEVLIPKTEKAFLQRVKTAILRAAETKWGEKGKKIVDGLGKDHPVKDGASSKNELAHECYILSAKSERKVNVVYANLDPIIDPDEIYYGCIVRAAINFYAFDFKGKKGIAVGLNSVMKVRDGKTGGTSDPAEDFAGFTSDTIIDDQETGDVF